MELILSATISGIGLGCLYGLIGLGVVLTYKATHVANFAQGALGTTGAFVVYEFAVRNGMSMPVAVVLAALSMCAFGVLLFLVVIAPRGGAGPMNLMVRTLGLQLLLIAVLQNLFGEGAPYRFPPLVESDGLRVGALTVSTQTLIAVAITLVLGIVLWAFFRFTSTGLVFRAVAEDPEVARGLGLRTNRVGMLVWAGGALLSLLAGVVMAPIAFLTPEMLEPYLLFAFVGVVLGGLTSLPGAVVGGVIIGIVSNVTAVTVNPEVATSIVFGVLLTVMLVRPHGMFGQPQAARL